MVSTLGALNELDSRVILVVRDEFFEGSKGCRVAGI